jgi:hypothetical protein
MCNNIVSFARQAGKPTAKSRFEHPRYLEDLRYPERFSYQALQAKRDPDDIMFRCSTESRSCRAKTILSLAG